MYVLTQEELDELKVAQELGGANAQAFAQALDEYFAKKFEKTMVVISRELEFISPNALERLQSAINSVAEEHKEKRPKWEHFK